MTVVSQPQSVPDTKIDSSFDPYESANTDEIETYDTDVTQQEKAQGLADFDAMLQGWRADAAGISIVLAKANASERSCVVRSTFDRETPPGTPTQVLMRNPETGRYEPVEHRPDVEAPQGEREEPRRLREGDESTCCTFGQTPQIIISSPAKLRRRGAIRLGPIRLRVEFVFEVTPVNAGFLRTGLCYEGKCLDEHLTGTVGLSVYFKLHITVSAPIKIKGIYIEAEAEMLNELTFPVDLSYDLSCAMP